MLLSDRMLAVVGLVEPCDRMADIGCDHGYVAMELVRRNVCGRVIAMDIHRGPLRRAQDNLRQYGMQASVETRLSDGMEALAAGEADGAICAGMGGRLILSILERGRGLIGDMRQLILQPQSEIREVRAWLRVNGFVTEQEDMVCEDGKYYPMMRVRPGGAAEGAKETDAAQAVRMRDTYGPYLLENAHPVLKRYLLWERENFENIRGNLACREQITARQQGRIAELDGKLGDIAFCLERYFAL
ncbi:MAG: class I SAM-dependent methyltransferase [Roseburia sp.]|nr:class I SAM-dependent methyltransferase [Roseburia sp.]